MFILEARHLYKTYDKVSVVHDISLEVQKGTATTISVLSDRGVHSSIVGPNGAGKTVLFNLICGYIRPDKGAILFEDRPIDKLPAWRRAHDGIGRLWQDIRLFRTMSVMENLMAARKNPAGERMWNLFFNLKEVLNQEKQAREAAAAILQTIGLSDKRNALAQDLSYGQQKLLALGRLLMNEAKLLLLDEPMSGLNPVMIDKLEEVMHRLVSEEGKTILMIEHNIPRAMDISNYVYVISAGELALKGEPKKVLSSPKWKEVYWGV